ncbi:MAG: hypothetical protein A2275_11400 [Bacteroidetes bacterium RIFOXYA12_FULL_35_11]|nr:MAG: hypothetical protein A2X01_04675 [Bacteroidetes bacterium GWF2_35_48]OFY74346.1 MAG: hypothetical protein A2275_11400 [Bacteroidetes bacterium RIFOXYA12_FULL_35_11]OFY94686.1 MAG: hypothetical protein A2309_02190 [Bacteroidetes bacterium RIFOXYB2_FULL_35_7]HBX51998.1 hypothetical protein [Bacteroidales bacterium]
MKKNLKLVIAGVALFLIAVIVIVKVQRNSGATVHEFARYIDAYSSGIISKKSSVKVRLTDKISETAKKNDEALEDVFNFSPSVKGKAIWADVNTLEFIPDEDFVSDKKYKVEFRLGKIADVPSEFEEFNFEFQVIKQNFELNIEEIITTDRKSFKLQKVLGTVLTSDVEDQNKIQKLLIAKQNSKNFSVKWVQGHDGLYWNFEIDSVQRFDNPSSLILSWNGESIDVEKSGDTTLEIPSLNNFKLLFHKVVQSPEQYVQLQFSDPLNANQNLLGLITISNLFGVSYFIEDNTINVYPGKNVNGKYMATIEEGIENINGVKFPRQESFEILFEDIKPAVRFVDKGVILPESDKGLIIPFEAVNIKAVDIKITKIYENNITQFLQENNLDGKASYELRRVAKAIIKKTLRLDQSNVVNFGKWNRFSLDMNKLIKADPGAIYKISLGFRKEYSLYNCGSNNASDENEEEERNYDLSENNFQDAETENEDYWDSFDGGYYGYYYGDWEDRENPCKDAYYGGKRTVTKNVLASNFGIIAKKGSDESVKIFVTDLKTTQPVGNVTIEVLDFQKQVLASGVTNTEGIIDFAKVNDPFFVIAKSEKQRGYLKLNEGQSLSLSRFDVSGDAVKKGLKGFIYGERGVWRPGDSLFISFILEENAEKLPDNLPVIFELRNPQFQLVKRLVEQKNSLNYYVFKLNTSADAPTGNWEAKVSVGGVSFNKSLKIENIKPNRLKINLDFGVPFLSMNSNPTARLIAAWLHGAPAKDMKASVNVILSPVKTVFEKYKDFQFDDASKRFYSESTTMYEGTTDEDGKTSFVASINTDNNAPGKLMANFITKVFEPSGNFSIDQFSLPYYPYKSFIGLKMPKAEKTTEMLVTDTTHKIEMILVNEKGIVVPESHEIEMEFYKLEWRWWWDSSEEELANYTGRSYIKPLKKEKIISSGGKASWNVRVNYPDWGRYLVRARDLKSGHSSSTVMYLDWPGWVKREQKNHAGGSTMLSFTADKEKYQIGDKVTITIPSAKGGRALLSIESGTNVIETHWIETQQTQTVFTFKATEKMTPNVYLNVTLLQPHAQAINDLPVRMYGIVPIYVENSATHLDPLISMPDELQSEIPVTIKVSEKNKKAMTYTLAVVDDGLLDLTRFKTPDPWNTFYAKQALGVLTWDIFDWVIGAYGGQLERLLAIGGDGAATGAAAKKANRFKPMVRFLGPFELKSGGQNSHVIKMPQYIGSVRTMVIAGKEKAYGFAEKTTPVTKPLMVLGTLPRVLGPGESVKLPVTVFAMKDHIKNVSVKIIPNNLLSVVGSSVRSLTFNKKGDQTVDFDVKVNSLIGIGKVKIEATSGNEKSVYDIELDVRNPNPKVTEVVAKVLDAGESWNPEIIPIGIAGTNKAVLEVSSIPPLNLGERLKFLIAYPHGCIEQTTSAVFSQLYLTDLMDLPANKKEDITRNVKAGIQKLQKFQMSNGGMSYWAGGNNTCEWGTSYAGHFLLEAEKKGYVIPSDLIRKWKNYQSLKARNWVDDGKQSQLSQAYRLYSLALANKPEIGAMNRLREKSKLSDDAKWRFAAAYQLAGKTKIAKEMIMGLSTNVQKYIELDYTFGSDVRDRAMILETLSLLDMRKKAFEVVKEISDELNKNTWLSTQTTAYSLIAISKFVVKNTTSPQLNFTYKLNGGAAEDKKFKNSVSQIDIPVKGTSKGSLSLKNTSKGILYARVILEGIPEVGETKDSENDLKMNIVYKTLGGKTLDPEKLPMGTDFMVELTVTHPGMKRDYKNLALTQIFPSGWEILNMRMTDAGNITDASTPTYQDIKDDRVYTYFDLSKGRSKTFRLFLNSSYAGKFYLPTMYVEAMYDNTINARRHGRWIEVVK